MLVVLLALSGCITVKPFSDQDVPRRDEDVAIINNRWGGCPWCIHVVQREEDNVVVFEADAYGYANPLKLIPGRYLITAGYEDPFIPGARARLLGTVELQAGHVYTMRMSGTLVRMFGHFKVWMTDDTESRTVAESP